MISAEFAVSVDVEVSWRRGFDGMDAATAVITIVVSGVGGGLLSSSGSDFWSRIKKLFRNIEQQERTDGQILVIHRYGEREIRFMCRTNQRADTQIEVVLAEHRHALQDVKVQNLMGTPLDI